MQKITGYHSTQNTDQQPKATKNLTYQDLIDYHLSKLEAKLRQEEKPLNVLNNHRTSLHKWLEYGSWINEGALGNGKLCSASLADSVGDELGVNFEKRRAEHLNQLEERGAKLTTRNARKSILGYLQRSWHELLRLNELPDNFPGALKFLIDRHCVSQKQIACWAGVSESLVSRWLEGTRLPSRAMLKRVALIEKGFNLQLGTLVFRLPSKLWGSKSSVPESRNTPYRLHLAEITKKPFCLKYASFTREQQSEWQTLFKFYTDAGWVAAAGLERHPAGWRTRQNNNKNSTAEMRLEFTEKFYGFLSLPDRPVDPNLRGVEFDPDNKEHVGVLGLDPQLTGKGFEPEKLSLALFTDAGLINEMINFLRKRSFKNSHNSHTQVFLNFCAQLTRAEKGFLYQFPEYGKRLEQQILNEEEWQKKCREGHKRIRRIISIIKNSRNKSERFNQTRDTTVEIVKPLIKERKHPVSVLTEIAEGLRYDFKRAGSAVDKATFFRNLVMVEILASNPMRAINLAEMKYKVGVKGYENETINLYKIEDGSFRLKYEEDELKNGAVRGRYDLPVNSELTEDLDAYFEVWRPLLVGADDCDFVFRPSPICLPSLLSRGVNTITLPMTTSGLSNIMRCISQRYILSKCAGFGLHSARHFVATEYLRFHPGAYEIAATILHDSEEMVRDTYSWVTPDDKIVFWNDHFTAILRKVRKEAA